MLQSLPADLRGRITSCGELIPDEAAALEFPPERQAIYETILKALSTRRRLRMLYRESELVPSVTTLLSLYRLARIRSQWTLVGHSSLHRQVRIYQVPWIQRLEVDGSALCDPAPVPAGSILGEIKPKRFSPAIRGPASVYTASSSRGSRHASPPGPDGLR